MDNLPAVVERDRKTFIGGSDAAAILGVSKWKTPLQLYLEKIGEYVDSPDEAKQQIFARGKRWEPVALEMLVDALQLRGHDVQVVDRNRVYKDTVTPFLECEIDAELLLDGEHVNVEIKTVHPFAAKEWGDMDTDQVPIYYASQAMHGLGITGRRLCIVGCLIGADSMTPYFVERDHETIMAMRDQCIQFWIEHVEARIPPDPSTMADMRFLFAKLNGKPAVVDEDTAIALRDIQNIRDRIKSFEDTKEELEFQVADAIRKAWGLVPLEEPDDNAVIICNGVEIGSWKRQQRDSIDGKKLRKNHPDIAAEHTSTSHFRIFRVKKL